MPLTPQDTLLFQGDSITDCKRDRRAQPVPPFRHQPAALGLGYVGKIAGRLLTDLPGIGIYNRGISGNQITDLAKRWQHDTLDLKPTVLTILIGVNDTWHGTAIGKPKRGSSLETYNTVYRQLLDQSLTALPDLRLILAEPFTLEAGEVPILNFEPELQHRRDIVRQIANDYQATLLPCQQLFDNLSQNTAEPSHWATDGVHPTTAGHQTLADLWLKTIHTP